MFNTYTEDIWQEFVRKARNGLSAGRRRALPEDDPRHLPTEDTEDDQEPE